MRPLLSLPLLPVLLTGCVSYGVGTTAAVLPAGERSVATLVEATPVPDYPDYACDDPSYGGSGDCGGTTTVVPMVSTETRFGFGGRSDWGVRVIGYSGLVASYKRALSPDTTGVQAAVVLGAGMLNGLNTLAGEATLVVSAREGSVTPYGGVRVQQTVPLNNSPQDTPTAGVFAGVRFGSRTLGISPEVGVHYDRSALQLRERSIVVVPVVTLHGQGLLGLLLPGR